MQRPHGKEAGGAGRQGSCRHAGGVRQRRARRAAASAPAAGCPAAAPPCIPLTPGAPARTFAAPIGRQQAQAKLLVEPLLALLPTGEALAERQTCLHRRLGEREHQFRLRNPRGGAGVGLPIYPGQRGDCGALAGLRPNPPQFAGIRPWRWKERPNGQLHAPGGSPQRAAPTVRRATPCRPPLPNRVTPGLAQADRNWPVRPGISACSPGGLACNGRVPRRLRTRPLLRPATRTASAAGCSGCLHRCATSLPASPPGYYMHECMANHPLGKHAAGEPLRFGGRSLRHAVPHRFTAQGGGTQGTAWRSLTWSLWYLTGELLVSQRLHVPRDGGKPACLPQSAPKAATLPGAAPARLIHLDLQTQGAIGRSLLRN